jgi:hypothetical protein
MDPRLNSPPTGAPVNGTAVVVTAHGRVATTGTYEDFNHLRERRPADDRSIATTLDGPDAAAGREER